MEGNTKNYKRCNGKRRLFMVDDFKIYKEIDFSFPSYMGTSKQVKSAALASMHKAIIKTWPSLNPLEISSLSDSKLGFNLSAMNLKLDGYILESVFQSSKVFLNNISYPEVINMPGREAKKIVDANPLNKLIGFKYKGEVFPLEPKSFFYDYIYIKALKENEDNLDLSELLNYNIFSDFYFNSAKQYNTQARSVAIYVSLVKKGLLDKALASPLSFKKIVYR